LTAPTGAVINFADSVVFKNGSSITAGTGNSISSTYDADITWNTTQTSKISAPSVPKADHRTEHTTSGKKVLDNDRH
ncbi:MAG: hypothetical protein LKI87_02250, partial [Prevotella sp.]